MINSSLMLSRALLANAVCAAVGLMSQGAMALTITPISSTTGIANALSNAALASGSGLSIVGGSATYQGTNTSSIQQSGTYSGFSLAPTSGSTPTLSLASGILLTTGSAVLPTSNTENATSTVTGSGSSALLSALSGSQGGSTATNDANVLSFSFTAAADITSVSAQFVFGTEEFPTQSVTDIFGFFVDGVNYAKFANGQLIANTPGNLTNFILNPVGADLYPIGYNGLTQVFTVTGLLGAGSGGAHTIMIGVADTDDSIYDSGVFFTSLTAGTSTGVVGITPSVPEPQTSALLAMGLAGVAFASRRRAKAAACRSAV